VSDIAVNRSLSLLLMATTLIGVGLPFVVGSYLLQMASFALINVIVAIGLTILIGQAGQVSLASPSFLAIGAYLVIYLTKQVGLSYWLAMPLAGIGAAACGAVLGFPALRVRGFYLAIVSLAFLQITSIIIEALPSYTGGVRGISVPRPTFFDVKLSNFDFYFVILAVTMLLYIVARNVVRSPMGRAFRAVNANENVAASQGTDVAQVKLIAFVMSSFYAGIAGAMFAPLVGFIDPLEFGLIGAIHHIVFIIVGGLGSVPGAVFGAVTMSVIAELTSGFKEYNELIFNLALLAVLFIMPHGLAGIAANVVRHVQRSRVFPAHDSKAGI
jgi:ABC-type branched-subunit amino acid transport system permease subunit